MVKGIDMPSQHTENSAVLVTGGAGFIGSHTVVELLQQGRKVVIADDLSNSNEKVLERIRMIVGDELFENLSFYRGDVCDIEFLTKIFNQHMIDSVQVTKLLESPLKSHWSTTPTILCRH